MRGSSISASVYERLLNDIITLHFRPGEKLSETQLSENYNVSRAPIRVALQKLQEDGLVEIRPQSGSVVSPVSVRRTVEILDIRLLLEPYALRLAFPNFTQRDIAELGQKLSYGSMMAPLSDERKQYFTDLDTDFHQLICNRSNNSVIPEILQKYGLEFARMRNIIAELSPQNRSDRPIAIEFELKEIYAAIKMQDVESACAALTSHLQGAKEWHLLYASQIQSN